MSYSSNVAFRRKDKRQHSSVVSLHIISFWCVRWNRMVLDLKDL